MAGSKQQDSILIDLARTLKWHFSALEPDDRGLNETRANACEIVAWRFLAGLSPRDAIDFCLYELPGPVTGDYEERSELGNGNNRDPAESNERSRLLPQYRSPDHIPPRPTTSRSTRQQLMQTITQLKGHIFTDNEGEEMEEDPTSSFMGLNALEIAAVADAKKFLSQRHVQDIINGIWAGEIVLWESLSVNTQKKAQFYNKRKSDPFTRLRVPKYIKTFEVLFFSTFLALYYAVLVERNPDNITPIETLLYIWIVAFAYDEFSEFIDAGLFYYTDFWSSWDLAIIGVGAAFFITSKVFRVDDPTRRINIGNRADWTYSKQPCHNRNCIRYFISRGACFGSSVCFISQYIEMWLTRFCRICSLLSLNPYFGALVCFTA